jgi:Protein of unknown function (DUF2911)
MKKLFAFTAIAMALFTASTVHAQEDKSKRASPPASVSQKIRSGATIRIDYSQPSVKGRTIGKDLEPMEGKVWRVGANENTIFETDKDVKVDGKPLPAGKYSIWGLKEGDQFTFIFNKVSNVWGTMYDKIKDKDLLRVTVKPTTRSNSTEKLTYTISPEGKVSLLWGTMDISFNVK